MPKLVCSMLLASLILVPLLCHICFFGKQLNHVESPNHLKSYSTIFIFTYSILSHIIFISYSHHIHIIFTSYSYYIHIIFILYSYYIHINSIEPPLKGDTRFPVGSPWPAAPSPVSQTPQRLGFRESTLAWQASCHVWLTARALRYTLQLYGLPIYYGK